MTLLEAIRARLPHDLLHGSTEPRSTECVPSQYLAREIEVGTLCINKQSVH